MLRYFGEQISSGLLITLTWGHEKQDLPRRYVSQGIVDDGRSPFEMSERLFSPYHGLRHSLSRNNRLDNLLEGTLSIQLQVKYLSYSQPNIYRASYVFLYLSYMCFAILIVSFCVVQYFKLMKEITIKIKKKTKQIKKNSKKEEEIKADVWCPHNTAKVHI